MREIKPLSDFQKAIKRGDKVWDGGEFPGVVQDIYIMNGDLPGMVNVRLFRGDTHYIVGDVCVSVRELMPRG